MDKNAAAEAKFYPELSVNGAPKKPGIPVGAGKVVTPKGIPVDQKLINGNFEE